MDSRELQDRLRAAFPDRPGCRIMVGLYSRDGRACAAEAITDSGSSAAHRLLFPGCLTKLLTASVTLGAISSAGVSSDSEVLPLLAARVGDTGRILAGITVRNLLEHTHGLDGSELDAAPIAADGRIDVGSLCVALRGAPRICMPGVMSNYGNVGAWLAAALAEQLTGRSYATLLKEMFRDRVVTTGGICAAAGGSLRVSLDGFMTFLESNLVESGAAPNLRVDADRPDHALTARPGWSLSERGTRLGWKYYGHGWFGHNSVLPGAPSIARVNAARGLAILVASEGVPVSRVLGRLLGELFPELVALRTPRRLDRARASALELWRYAGRYACRRVALDILQDERGRLRLDATHRNVKTGRLERYGSVALTAARDDIFAANPPRPGMPRFIQFLESSEGLFRYLWDGESLFPKTTDVVSR